MEMLYAVQHETIQSTQVSGPYLTFISGGGGGQIAQRTAEGGAQSREVAISPREARKKFFTCSF